MAEDPKKTDTKNEAAATKDAQGRITNTQMTAANAAKLVRRMVPKLNEKNEIIRDREGNPVAVPQAIKESEVMSFAEYDDRVVVVTTSGEKLEAEKK